MSPWAISGVEEHNKGLSAKKKRQWIAVANGALQKCIADGGTDATCAAGAIRQANAVVANNEEYSAYNTLQDNNYALRTETHQGRPHLVVPVIMMVEGVHNGTRGPLLHLASELGKVTGCWNGMPITVHHPQEGEGFISANHPHVIDSQVVGRVYNTVMHGNKLKAEAWLDTDRLQTISPLVLAYIHQQRPLEVSVGVFTDDEMTEGLWNGEAYAGIAYNHRPDHLALLPGGTGACSWADGCGIRANQENKQEGGETEMTIDEALKLVKENGLSVHEVMVHGETGLNERLSKIRSKLDSLDTLQKINFLEEVYDNYLIYETRMRGGDIGSVSSNMFKQNYAMSANGEVEFTGDPTPVKKEVKYVPVGQTNNNLDSGGAAMAEKKKCCPEKVALLVMSKESPFQEADREWIESLDEPQVDKMVVMMEMAKKEDAPKSITKEEAIQALQEQFADPEKFMKLLPSDVQEQIRHGMNLHKAEKTKLITLITANSERWTAEKLESKSLEDLTDLASLIKQPEVTDYSLLGGGNGSAQNADDMLPPPGVELSV